jgi:fructokinase
MRVVCVGEALIDFKGTGHLAFQGYLGGSPFNIAVACARLNARVSFLTQLSTDRFGRLLQRHLEENAVDVSLLAHSPAPTTLAFVDEVDGEPSFEFLANGSADTLFDPRPRPQLPEDTGLVQFGSISLLSELAASSIVDIVRAHQHLVTVLDPNVRPALIADRDEYLERLHGWLGLTRVVKASRQDLRWLTDRPEEQTVADWFERGVRVALITDGSRGARAYLANGVKASAPAPAVEVVDTVGAGDTFMGAVLASLANDHDAVLPEDEESWSRILRIAGQAAALNCTRAGADPPTAAELAAALGPTALGPT